MGDIDVEAQETVAVPVTWNDADRDAGIDWWIANAVFWHEQCLEAWRFRDANAAEVARLRSVVAGIEALAAEAIGLIGDGHGTHWDSTMRYGAGCEMCKQKRDERERLQRRLRSVLSDTKER